ncbi:zinc ribbon domain-containing protein [uncultured Celeribacter sp.]|uniref:zinc ribbon domain-containing protein n=1 Tax=uncultured Celeribacter sp. TaxID=1303376 RepID=UPI002AA750E6|nr:zinc ribbon domain-containing protein [uncultured Celeribacter sp.]
MSDKQRRPRPFPLPQGTVVRIDKCACCGGRVQVKINVSGKAYYNCGNFDAQGQSCGFGVRWGAVKSEAIRADYHRREGIAPAPMVAANTNAAPSAAPRSDTPVNKPETANDDRAPVTKRKAGDTLNDYGY